jgi:hypothetical protein
MPGRDTYISHAELWGGPEDGALVWVPQLLPDLLGVHRMQDGTLIPIRDQRQLMLEHAHVSVYRHAPDLEGDGRVRPVYRWCSRPPGQVDA